MDTCLDMSLAAAYTSHSQRARVVTEDWVERNMYCPPLWLRSSGAFEGESAGGGFCLPPVRGNF